MSYPHSHGVHCMHVHGWHINVWCHRCKCDWQESCGKAGCKGYERRTNQTLARQVVLDMHDDKLDIPAELLSLMATPELPDDPWWRDSEI